VDMFIKGTTCIKLHKSTNLVNEV